MKTAIIGTGISGVTLALRLQQLGVETTLFADRSPAALRTGRVENLVARFAATQERERLLGVAHWRHIEQSLSHGIEIAVTGTPIHFTGRLAGGAQVVDFRQYLSRLVEDYTARGGQVELGSLPSTADELTRRTAGHDVVVVAVGRAAPVGAELFAVRPDRSPFEVPQRRLLGGLCTGVDHPDPPSVCITLLPGGGELFCQPLVTGAGLATAFLIEAVPGGPLEPFTQLDPDRDRSGTKSMLLGAFEQYAPALASRIDRDRFSLLGPNDWLAGGVTPTVRRAWASLPDGRLSLAIGDAWIANDPILGQGANIGSHCAWVTAQALAADPELDEAFGARLEDEMWSFAGPVTAATNAFLQPPPAHVLDLLGAANAHQSVADALVGGFADPVKLAHTLASPAATAALVEAACRPLAA